MKKALIEGPISADQIARSIENHRHKTEIGAHQIFLGQVRADELEPGQIVSAIEFTAHEEMAEAKIAEIRERAFEKFDITCSHIYHSLGTIAVGELCFFVFVSSPHRQASTEACQFLVESIKAEVPIFGKEMTPGGTFRWKENTPQA